VLARKLHHHFTQNPHFERLPKKFKIGVDAGYTGSRHLIQDLGLVLTGTVGGQDCYDVWMAGGLGREPQPAFLFERGVIEERLIPLIEVVVSVYRRQAPLGKRLKHLVRERGEDWVRMLIAAELAGKEPLLIADGFDKQLTLPVTSSEGVYLEAPIFAGELPVADLRRLTTVASGHAGGFLVLTCDQNVAFIVQKGALDAAAEALDAAGFRAIPEEKQVIFRICPGSHECRMGLAPTRDVARSVIDAMGPTGAGLSWAISGCHNSCAQPQLAGAGIVVSGLIKGDDGERSPRFDLYRRVDPDGFGSPVSQGLTLAELIEAVGAIGWKEVP
jgi:sulfite reductase beta subunit-like hemoprotein